MKVFVSTREKQGERSNDFFYTKPGELVRFGLECDGERIDGSCGCRRAMTGFDTLKATTTFMVVDRDLSENEYTDLVKNSLIKAGYITDSQNQDDLAWVLALAGELLMMAAYFPIGHVLEKRGDNVQIRVIEN